MDTNETPIPVSEKTRPGQKPLQVAPIQVELVHRSKGIAFVSAFLLLCGVVCCVAWVAHERTSFRILHPESKLSVLELEEKAIKFRGFDAGVLKDHSQIAISLTGWARLGVDFSKSTFEVDRWHRRVVISLPAPEVTDVNVTDTKCWDRSTNVTDAKRLDKLECDLRNEALSDFRNLASNSFYVDTARKYARVALRAYYRRNYPDWEVEFK